MITVIHFHLVNAIMIGKKKATDIQFYVEVVEAVRDVEKDKKMMFDQVFFFFFCTRILLWDERDFFC